EVGRERVAGDVRVLRWGVVSGPWGSRGGRSAAARGGGGAWVAGPALQRLSAVSGVRGADREGPRLVLRGERVRAAGGPGERGERGVRDGGEGVPGVCEADVAGGGEPPAGAVVELRAAEVAERGAEQSDAGGERVHAQAGGAGADAEGHGGPEPSGGAGDVRVELRRAAGPRTDAQPRHQPQRHSVHRQKPQRLLRGL